MLNYKLTMMMFMRVEKHSKINAICCDDWECKIVCVKSNCADLFYAPYWGKQLKGWISNGKT